MLDTPRKSRILLARANFDDDWANTAYLRSRAAVDTDLQAKVMDLIRRPFDSIREPGRIGYETVGVRIAMVFVRPTVIDIHVFVACILHVYKDGTPKDSGDSCIVPSNPNRPVSGPR